MTRPHGPPAEIAKLLARRRLSDADLRGVGALLAGAARLIRERGHPLGTCAAADERCAERAGRRLCARCAVTAAEADAVLAEAGPFAAAPGDKPAPQWFVAWRRWRRLAAAARPFANACARAADPAAALAATAAAIFARTRPPAPAPAPPPAPGGEPEGRTPQ